MNYNLLQIFSFIFCFIINSLLPAAGIRANTHKYSNFSQDLVSQETIKMAGLPEKLRLKRENHEYGNLEDQDLSYMLFPEANLANAELTRSNFRGAILIGADLRSAFLQNADLRGADLTRANLKKADLRGANLEGAKLLNADLEDAYVDEDTNFSGAELENCNLKGVDIKVLKLPAFSTIKEGSLVDDDNAKLYIILTKKPDRTSLSRTVGENLRKKLSRPPSDPNLIFNPNNSGSPTSLRKTLSSPRDNKTSPPKGHRRTPSLSTIFTNPKGSGNQS